MLEILDVALGDTTEWRAVDEGSMVGAWLDSSLRSLLT